MFGARSHRAQNKRGGPFLMVGIQGGACLHRFGGGTTRSVPPSR